MKVKRILELGPELPVPDADRTPAFIAAAVWRLREAYPEGEGFRITLGRSVVENTVQWCVRGYRGLTGGFDATFRMQQPDLTAGSVTVTRCSRLCRVLVWIAMGLALVVSLAILLGTGSGPLPARPLAMAVAAVVVGLAFVGSAWLVAGLIAHLGGGALSNNALVHVANTILEVTASFRGVAPRATRQAGSPTIGGAMRE